MAAGDLQRGTDGVDTVVVDTDVVSFLFRDDTRAALYRPHLEGNLLLVSFMAVAELDQWVLERRWGERRRAELQEHLRSFVVVSVTRSLCRIWADVRYQARRRGRPISGEDAWHAATALRAGVRLVTHNRRDYFGVPELRVISEAP